MTGYTVDLADAGAEDTARVGGKVAGLARLVRADVRVPPAFALTRRAFDEWLDQDDAARRVAEVIEGSGVDLVEAERRVDGILATVGVPPAVVSALHATYDDLAARTGEPDPLVAVRSSATTEDSHGNSFAGEYVTFLNVRGREAVVDAVHRCWRSAFRREPMAYAVDRGVDLSAMGMAVAVQSMVRARSAGVMFTLNPVSGDRSRIHIEGTRGLGDAVVGGEVTPERFVVDKVTLDVTAPDADACLTRAEVAELAATGKRLERLLGHPLDLEWAVDERWPFPDSVVFVQCRPETVWSKRSRDVPYDSGAPAIDWISANLVGRRPTP